LKYCIKLDHVLRVESLELHHRDPFDRILIGKRLEEDLPIVISIPGFERYLVQLIGYLSVAGVNPYSVVPQNPILSSAEGP
jgi:hypothetical protein